MATIAQRPRVQVEMTLLLSEEEARALEAITSYGTKAFLEHFYKHMGTTYLKPYENGVLTLFDSVRVHVCPILSRTDAARKVFEAREP